MLACWVAGSDPPRRQANVDRRRPFRLCDRWRGSGGLHPGEQALDGRLAHSLPSRGGAAGRQYLRSCAGRRLQGFVQSEIRLAIRDGAERRHLRTVHPDAAGQDARRLHVDQRHELQSRAAGGFRRLGQSRQSRLGLCRRPASLQANRTADRSLRRQISWN